MGFIKGKSIKDNALKHQARRVIVHFDIKDFFPSITAKRIIGFSRKVLSFDFREKKHFETQVEINKMILRMKFVLKKTKIKYFSYLGADYIPYIVEFGVLLNQCSVRVKIYHNFINEKKNSSSRVRKLKKGKHSKDEFEDEVIR